MIALLVSCPKFYVLFQFMLASINNLNNSQLVISLRVRRYISFMLSVRYMFGVMRTVAWFLSVCHNGLDRCDAIRRRCFHLYGRVRNEDD